MCVFFTHHQLPDNPLGQQYAAPSVLAIAGMFWKSFEARQASSAVRAVISRGIKATTLELDLLDEGGVRGELPRVR